MKCVMVMFDSLNRHMLEPYAAQTWVKTPNFTRLAERAVTFDSSYVSSMPCMPARRELHTGRPNFLHNSWGPLEPFDDSMPAMLSAAGVYTHLVTDHYHYFENGGATYHTRYDSWEFFRGQEGDPWIGQVAEPDIPPHENGKGNRQDWVNRQHLRDDRDYPQSRTFAAGLDFIDRNHEQDDWFLQIECFDPHEPFTTAARWRDLYPSPDRDQPLFDWPPYGRVEHAPEQIDAARRNYAALVSKCDDSLGQVLDRFDHHHLWEDTLLIVWTDHGFLLGEHGWWAKNVPPLYDQVAHTPMFIHDPRNPRPRKFGNPGPRKSQNPGFPESQNLGLRESSPSADASGRRKALVQPAIDLAPTLLNYFGLEPTQDMRGHDLAPVIADDTPVRRGGIFGYHGRGINYVDDDHVYLRGSRPGQSTELYRYTLMPTIMRGFAQLEDAQLVEPLPFSKNMPLLRLPEPLPPPPGDDLLFNRIDDFDQARPLDDAPLAAELDRQIATLMADYDAPAEQYARLALTPPAPKPRPEPLSH
ncbi:MAG: sulfatase [Planctomycetota bacterium]